MLKKIINNIKNKKIKVGIIGLGYVGLPLAFRFLNKKISVIGIDIDPEKIKKIKRGVSYIENKKFKKDKFYDDFRRNVSSNYKNIFDVDFIIICLPTPLNKSKKPDISILKNCINKIRINLRFFQTLILESTVYPGATEELFSYINKKNKFELGKNFYLVFSPERENPGDKLFSYKKTPKVVSGYSKNCARVADHLYRIISNKVYVAKNIKVAELSKLLENTYRSVNIGLINEFKIITSKLKINVWDVIAAAKTKNFGFRPFNPGPGVGGHCIPIDPIYLSWYMKKKKYNSKIIENSSKLNSNMPNFVSRKIINYLKTNKVNVKNILIIGLAYKKNTGDTRESPSIDIIKKLIDKKYKVQFYDPYIKKYELIKSKYFNNNGLSFSNIKKHKKDSAIIIATDHENINYKKLLSNSNLIFDTRGVYSNKRNQNVIFV